MVTRSLLVAICFVLFKPAMASGAATTPVNMSAIDSREFVFLTVDKKKLAAELKTWPETLAESKVIRTFRIAIGKEQGDKQKKGDNRTPEGVYFTRKIIDDDNLPPKYGPNAITLDYPNPVDRAVGKTGYGIWLHGVIKDERVEEANVTEGCVAFYNADIVKLTRWLRPYQGVVVIADDSASLNQTSDVEMVKTLTGTWMQSWRDRDIDRYMEHYDGGFTYAGKNWDQYRTYKARVFKSYKSMDVSMHKLRVLTHPKYAVSLMDQDFNGDNRFRSDGRKILYWQRTGDQKWRISREVFERRRFEFVDLKNTLSDSSSSSQAALPSSDANNENL